MRTNLTILLFAFSLTVLGQNTILVPSNQPTIQAAIDSSSAGDTVVVAPGTYLENIDFHGKAIAVRSQLGPDVTIIDGNQAGPTVSFVAGEGPSSILSGFMVRNGLALNIFQGGGINIKNSSPAILGNVITGNRACQGGGGVLVFQGSPLIKGNRVTSNSQDASCAGGLGGGIYVVSVSTAQILNNEISNNTFGTGAGVAIDGGPVLLSGNLIAGNAAQDGGGVSIFNNSGPVKNQIIQNVIVQNRASNAGAGIFLVVGTGQAGAILINNTVADNDSGGGSAIRAYLADAQTSLINNLVIARAGQVAVYCGISGLTASPAMVSNDVFASGAALFGGTCADPTGSNGNISADPLFKNAAAGDYHLQEASPAIDAGNNGSSPAADFDGIQRPLDGNLDGIATVDLGAYEFVPPVVAIGIDVKPGGVQNTINVKSEGTIPVALLSATGFDVSVQVNLASLTFGRTGNEHSLALCDPNAPDVNGDGLPDLICHFYTAATGIQDGDTNILLRGLTTTGSALLGRDHIRLVGFK